MQSEGAGNEAILQFVTQISMRAAVSPEPGAGSKLAKRLRVIGDGEVSKLPSQPSVACMSGCSACCHRVVTATVPEIEAIVQEVASWDTDRMTALKVRLGAYGDAARPYWRYEDDRIAACPFLEGDRCSIYETRPLGCRQLSSPDAEHCRGFYLRGDGPRPPEREGEANVLRGIEQSVVLGYQLANRPSGYFDMPQSVLACLEGGTIPDSLKVFSETIRTARVTPPYLQALVQRPAVARYRELNEVKMGAAACEAVAEEKEPFGLMGQLIGPGIYRSEEDIDQWHAHWARTLDRLEEAKFSPQRAWESLEILTPFFLAYAGIDVKPLMERFMRVAVEKWAAPFLPTLVAPIEGQRRPGPLRVGYASYRLTEFNGSRWALGWLLNHGKEIETYAFNLMRYEDRVSSLWHRNADHYFHLPITVPDAGTFIRSLDLDALIIPDIGMDGVNLQLATLRLARHQFTAWGHPVTSGSPMIDGYLSSDLMEPANGQDHYTERLVRLPGSGLTYPRLLPRASVKSAGDFGLPASFFLVPQVVSKLLPQFDYLYAEISRRTGRPIVFLAPSESWVRGILEERLAKIPGSILLERQSARDYMRLLQLCHAVLDTPEWNGGNTTIEALSYGKPVVSLPGMFMRGRHGIAFLTQAGVPDLLCDSEEDYIALACDQDRLQSAMRGLHAEALFEDLAPVRALDALLLSGGW